MDREAELARSLVELADTLVAEFDVVELLTVLADRCVELLDVAAAGIMLVGVDGALHVMASSSEAMRMLELYELQAAEGPCLDCHRSGQLVTEADLAAPAARWPRFAAHATAAGFRSVAAVPMRLRGPAIGALNLFRVTAGDLAPQDVVVAQALADMATIAVLQHRATADAERLNAQLSQALDSRIVLEQAKGMVAAHDGITVQDAFALVRQHARNHNLKLTDVARSVIDRAIAVADLGASRPRRG